MMATLILLVPRAMPSATPVALMSEPRAMVMVRSLVSVLGPSHERERGCLRACAELDRGVASGCCPGCAGVAELAAECRVPVTVLPASRDREGHGHGLAGFEGTAERDGEPGSAVGLRYGGVLRGERDCQGRGFRRRVGGVDQRQGDVACRGGEAVFGAFHAVAQLLKRDCQDFVLVDGVVEHRDDQHCCSCPLVELQHRVAAGEGGVGCCGHAGG